MAMADWSSLPSDLVRCVGDRLLAASDSDIDDYMGMGAVCHNWRQAMADPCRRSTGADLLRFRPRHWVMLDDAADDEGTVRLFFKVVTGRIIRRRVPLLRCHLLVAHLTAGKPSPLPFPHPAGRPYCPKNASMAAHRGHVYVADRDAQVVRCVVASGRC